MKKLISLTLSILIIFSLFTGCSTNKKEQLPDTSPYNFISYDKYDDITDIQEVSLSKRLSKICVSYKFTYLSDGNRVKSYISIPLECIESYTPYKCIVYNRGGNSRIGYLNDEDTANICSATNRIVIASQYRGADGGTGTDQFGGNDLNDVLKLIDLCDNIFEFIDISDLCVAGVSRGGMMSYMSAREDDRVKGVIAISAVSDLFQSYEEREDMKTLLNNYIGGSPNTLPDEYENRSAIYWANELQIPILIIHSKFDEQVSFSQAEAVYNKLKVTNPNCTLITYDDNTHGLHTKDSKEISDWINRNFSN